MFGFFCTSHIKNSSSISLNFSMICGLVTTNFPTITTTYNPTAYQDAGQSTLTGNSAYAFGFTIGLGLEKELNEHFSVYIRTSFSFAFESFSSLSYNLNLDGLAPIETSPGNTTSMTLGLFEPVIGVDYAF
jgi:hypothetical protein